MRFIGFVVARCWSALTGQLSIQTIVRFNWMMRPIERVEGRGTSRVTFESVAQVRMMRGKCGLKGIRMMLIKSVSGIVERPSEQSFQILDCSRHQDLNEDLAGASVLGAAQAVEVLGRRHHPFSRAASFLEDLFSNRFWCRQATGIGDNEIWRIVKRNGVLHRRRESVEHPFGSTKHWMGDGGFLMRRLENVRGEFSLTALACNIRHATTLAGIPELIAAVRPGAPRGAFKPAGIALQRACCNASGRMASANRHNPITAQIGLSHRKIRLGPTFHAVSLLCATVLFSDSLALFFFTA